MKDFVVRHPETARALQILQGNPFSSGFADASYNGLDAFRFVNAARRIDTGSWQGSLTMAQQMQFTAFSRILDWTMAVWSRRCCSSVSALSRPCRNIIGGSRSTGRWGSRFWYLS
jgi:hypothetical protein